MKSTPQTTCASACLPLPRVFKALLWLLAAAFALPALADTGVDQLLAAEQAPEGVVIEIVEGDEDALGPLLPKIRTSISKLRERFPDLEIAVVSHGGEQFALQERYGEEYANIHAGVQSLVADAVPVHVCGAHAGWYGITPEDFPDYVDVSPSGPAQINQYRALGYVLVKIGTDD